MSSSYLHPLHFLIKEAKVLLMLFPLRLVHFIKMDVLVPLEREVIVPDFFIVCASTLLNELDPFFVTKFNKLVHPECIVLDRALTLIL